MVFDHTRRKRAAVLRSLLERDSVFLTESFRERYEDRARQNVARSLARLEKAPGRRLLKPAADP